MDRGQRMDEIVQGAVNFLFFFYSVSSYNAVYLIYKEQKIKLNLVFMLNEYVV